MWRTVESGRFGYQRQTVASSGGSIDIRAAEGIQLAGDLKGRAGAGKGAGGGELSYEINPLTRAEPDEISAGQKPFPAVPSVIEVSAAPEIQNGAEQGRSIAAGQHGRGLFDAGWVEEGGFSALKLKTPDRIDFLGDNTLRTARSVELDARWQLARACSRRAEAG